MIPHVLTYATKLSFSCRVVVVATLLIVSSCQNGEQSSQTVPASGIELEASNTVWDTDIVFTDSIVTKAMVHARRARLYGNRQETLLDSGVTVRFFDVDGSCLAVLTCREARIDNGTNAMNASGNVVIDSKTNATRVESATMNWDNTRRMLSSRDYVKVTRPGELLEGGVGFESNASMSTYRIFHVTGVKQQ